ncbi:MAG TPA: CrcB family protein [Micromonosporaceae bacterium]
MNSPLPTDPDVDLHQPRDRAEFARHHAPVLGAIAAGGALGSLARYGLSVAMPPPPNGFPLATFVTNVGGCLLIGVLMVLITEVWTGQRLLRPFLGVGVLGGFTTFSTSIVDVQRLVNHGRAATALLYLFATLAAALLAVIVGMTVTEYAVRSAR